MVRYKWMVRSMGVKRVKRMGEAMGQVGCRVRCRHSIGTTVKK